MQKWEYAGCRVWRGYVLSANIGGKIEAIAEPTYHKPQDYRIKGKELTFVDFLNQLGREGWELVALCESEVGSPGNSVEMRAILKRPAA